MDPGAQLLIVARLALAPFLGAFIGLERELRGSPAGVRTVALVTAGSALFTEVSQVSGTEDRIAAGIVTGIGFLGAGLIFREGYTVRGITTAATRYSSRATVFALLEARPVVRRLETFILSLGRELVLHEEPEDHREKRED